VLGPSFEVIVVDNVSHDHTVGIAKFYESSFPNFRVAFQPISGAGAARNMGLHLARGQYLMFLDADDLLTRKALLNLAHAIEVENADIVTSPLRIFSRSSVSAPLPTAYSQSSYTLPYFDAEAGNSDENNRYITALLSDFGACAKLYRIEFLRAKKITFEEGKNYEDNLFVYKAYSSSSVTRNIREVTYLYRKNWFGTSATQSTQTDVKSYEDFVAVTRGIIEFIASKGSQSAFRKHAIVALSARLDDMERHFATAPNAAVNRFDFVGLRQALNKLEDYEN
jgi:glycosyltransferase involved in cell wall biosynthesis